MAPTRSLSQKSSSRKSSSRKSTLGGGITKKSQHQPVLSAYADLSEIVPGGSPDQGSPRSPRSPRKIQPAKQKHAKIVIDDKELACAKCIAGHRVGKCNHTTKPMFEPNNPGRPKNGQSTKCKCPKACNCPPEDKCKCPKNCVCVRRVFLIVYYPGPGEHPEFIPDVRGSDTWTGEFRIYESYLGNSEGAKWPEEYLRQRGYQQTAPTNEPQGSEQTPAAATTTAAAAPTTAPLPPSQAMPQACGGSCSHENAVALENQQPVDNMQHMADDPSATSSAPPAGALRHGCNCGASCACIFCPQHSYNEVTMASAHRMLASLFDAGRLNNVSQDIISITPNFDLSASCMGSQPLFGYTTQLPPDPSPLVTTQLPPNPFPNGAPWAPYSSAYPSVLNGTFPTHPNVAVDGYLGQPDFSTGALPIYQDDTFNDTFDPFL